MKECSATNVKSVFQVTVTKNTAKIGSFTKIQNPFCFRAEKKTPQVKRNTREKTLLHRGKQLTQGAASLYSVTVCAVRDVTTHGLVRSSVPHCFSVSILPPAYTTGSRKSTRIHTEREHRQTHTARQSVSTPTSSFHRFGGLLTSFSLFPVPAWSTSSPLSTVAVNARFSRGCEPPYLFYLLIVDVVLQARIRCCKEMLDTPQKTVSFPAPPHRPHHAMSNPSPPPQQCLPPLSSSLRGSGRCCCSPPLAVCLGVVSSTVV